MSLSPVFWMVLSGECSLYRVRTQWTSKVDGSVTFSTYTNIPGEDFGDYTVLLVDDQFPTSYFFEIYMGDTLIQRFSVDTTVPGNISSADQVNPEAIEVQCLD